MAAEIIRIGIIGAGANTRKMHIPRLHAIEGVQIVEVANRTTASAQKVADEFQIPTGSLAMQIRPGSDDDGVDFLGLDNFLPMISNGGDLELVSNFLGGGWGPVRDLNDLNSFYGLEFRNMHFPRIGLRDRRRRSCFHFRRHLQHAPHQSKKHRTSDSRSF